jgi:hypothetical protein
MIILALVLALSGAVGQEGAAQEGKQEHKVPKDSVYLVVSGCLKGRVLAVSDVRQEDTQVGPIVKARSFRLAGKKDVMNDVKEQDGHLVDVTGLVKKSSLVEPGIKVGKGVTIGGGPPVAGSGGSGHAPVPNEYVPVLDVDSVRMRASSCGTKGN